MTGSLRSPFWQQGWIGRSLLACPAPSASSPLWQINQPLHGSTRAHCLGRLLEPTALPVPPSWKAQGRKSRALWDTGVWRTLHSLGLSLKSSMQQSSCCLKPQLFCWDPSSWDWIFFFCSVTKSLNVWLLALSYFNSAQSTTNVMPDP